jgi:hypothetical protein
MKRYFVSLGILWDFGSRVEPAGCVEDVIFGVTELLPVSPGLLLMVFVLYIVFYVRMVCLMDVTVSRRHMRYGWVFYTSHNSAGHSMNPSTFVKMVHLISKPSVMSVHKRKK